MQGFFVRESFGLQIRRSFFESKKMDKENQNPFIGQ